MMSGPLPRTVRFCTGWLLAHLIALPVALLVWIAIGADALGSGISWLVDDRPWTIWLFAKADRVENWARRP